MDHDAVALAQINQSISDSKLVIVVGTGVSLGLTGGSAPQLSWTGLVGRGFEYARQRARITQTQLDAWQPQLNSADLDDLLSAAEFLGRKLDAPNGLQYARWLDAEFSNIIPQRGHLYDAINMAKKKKIPIATLNYDTILESVTGLPGIILSDVGNVAKWTRREYSGILHLHGRWNNPESCVLGIRDYQNTMNDQVRDLIQRSLSAFNRLLFVGCGGTFEDPNFTALTHWLRANLGAAAPQHFALVKSSDVMARHADPAWRGFVDPISYGESSDQLSEFIINTIEIGSSSKSKRVGGRRGRPISNSSTIMENYRAHIVKDCGQMTIEGVRADMDTAQRRFDLEKLFVPLSVRKVAPDFPLNDPDREDKLAAWHEENGNSQSFGQALSAHKRIALLALPGGGKTLLLKRLVVAYADADRRLKSDDDLPEISTFPILIKCREWREYIRRPILELLSSIPEITGVPELAGIREAILPLLRSGELMLLVDGLDEIHNDADRETFVEHLEQFLEEYPLIRLVVTSREAGFSLVAPTLVRFCDRLRIDPLDDDAISALCNHWHDLMSGGAAEAIIDGRDVARHLISNPSLRRLAENPLLLTMLLVVKHGAGRLPPDRVSLYERAVEVLLDTWNIKGHEPLKLKEAIPQLSCVAFEMMKDGRQTATASELLEILENAREKIPHIRRYATGTADEFLRRVELRSSLLLEAGHKLEGIKAVPFYQFRHLTFQEYLAAVAVTEGHYLNYRKGDTVLSPLEAYLAVEEWKEVVPMAAVLSRKQAEPLMAALVADAVQLGKTLRERAALGDESDWPNGIKLPPVVARIVQCLAEEAEVSPETLISALQIVALFAHGCQSADSWEALSRGPYGEELLHQTWILYESFEWPRSAWVRNTFARLAAHRESKQFWWSDEGQARIAEMLESKEPEIVTRAVLTCAGVWWDDQDGPEKFSSNVARGVENALFAKEPATAHAATWTWAIIRRKDKAGRQPDVRIMNRLVSLFLEPLSYKEEQSAADFAIDNIGELPRESWSPILNARQKAVLRKMLSVKDASAEMPRHRMMAAAVVCYFSGDVFSLAELREKLSSIENLQMAARTSRAEWLLAALGISSDGGKARRASRPRRHS